MNVQNSYTHPKMQRQLADGYSGALTVTAATGKRGTPTMVFVDSELLGKLVLTATEAAELGTALADAAAEGLPPSEGNLKAFRSVFGHRAPAKHSRTAADLQRHVQELSDVGEAAGMAAFGAGAAANDRLRAGRGEAS